MASQVNRFPRLVQWATLRQLSGSTIANMPITNTLTFLFDNLIFEYI